MEKPLCPFLGKKCSEKCALFRKGFVYFPDNTQPPQEFETCTFNFIGDILEAILRRQTGQQRATEQTRNAIYNLQQFFENIVKRRVSLPSTIIVEELEGKKEEDG